MNAAEELAARSAAERLAVEQRMAAQTEAQARSTEAAAEAPRAYGRRTAG